MQLDEIFDRRSQLTEKDFYEKYFEDKDVPFLVVLKIRQILEDVLDADLSQLSAEDDFFKNLNFFWQYDSLADVEMFEQIEEEFDIEFHQSDFSNLDTLTIKQIVDIVWEKVQEKETSH